MIFPAILTTVAGQKNLEFIVESFKSFKIYLIIFFIIKSNSRAEISKFQYAKNYLVDFCYPKLNYYVIIFLILHSSIDKVVDSSNKKNTSLLSCFVIKLFIIIHYYCKIQRLNVNILDEI